MLNFSQILSALLLTTAAGLTMCLGAVVSMLFKPSNRANAFILAFSAGLMIYLALFDLIPESFHTLILNSGIYSGSTFAIISLAAGIAFTAIIEKLFPDKHHNHRKTLNVSNHSTNGKPNSRLKRTGVLLAIFIGIHNLPEGMALFVTACDSLPVAISLFLGIALHNIPEGMAVYNPVFLATENKKIGFLYTLGSGMMQPVGALLALTMFLPFWDSIINAVCLCLVAGMLLYICFKELIPQAFATKSKFEAILGLLAGLAIMALSIIFFHHH